MLSGLLKSDVAIEVNINIMRAFVAMRNYLATTTNVTDELVDIRVKLRLLEHDNEATLQAVNDLSEDVRRDISLLYTAITELASKPAPEPRPRRPIGFKR